MSSYYYYSIYYLIGTSSDTIDTLGVSQSTENAETEALHLGNENDLLKYLACHNILIHYTDNLKGIFPFTW